MTIDGGDQRLWQIECRVVKPVQRRQEFADVTGAFGAVALEIDASGT
jgi:hypothetical protein